MIPQTQSRTGEKNGRCFEACLASILELREDQVPDFARDGDQFLIDVQTFLDSFDLYYVQVPVDSPGLREAFKSGGGTKIYHTIEGLSPRGGMHAIVGCNGEPIWDPHPPDGSGRNLVRTDCFGLLCAR